MRRRPTVLALDLEGTLISNAVSQIPRPGLQDFLCACRRMFPRIVAFTTVTEARFRDIARLLVEENFAPPWFAELEYVVWNGEKKDLRFIENADPAEVVLIDDFERYVHPDQRQQWLEAEYFGPPYRADDEGLERLQTALQDRVNEWLE